MDFEIFQEKKKKGGMLKKTWEKCKSLSSSRDQMKVKTPTSIFAIPSSPDNQMQVIRATPTTILSSELPKKMQVRAPTTTSTLSSDLPKNLQVRVPKTRLLSRPSSPDQRKVRAPTTTHHLSRPSSPDQMQVKAPPTKDLSRSSSPYRRMIRSKSWTTLCSRARSPRSSLRLDKVLGSANKNPRPGPLSPRGCLSVYVGPEKQRFVIKIRYTNHPLFKELLEEAESEYGFNSNGPLTLPCNVDFFTKVLDEIEANELDGNSNNIRCRFPTSRSSSYRLLSPSKSRNDRMIV